MEDSTTSQYIQQLAGAVRSRGLVVQESASALVVQNTATGPVVSNPLYPSGPLSQRVDCAPDPITGDLWWFWYWQDDVERSQEFEREPIAPADEIDAVAELAARVVAAARTAATV